MTERELESRTKHFMEVMRWISQNTLAEDSAWDKLWEELPYTVRRDVFHLAALAFFNSDSGGTT